MSHERAEEHAPDPHFEPGDANAENDGPTSAKYGGPQPRQQEQEDGSDELVVLIGQHYLQGRGDTDARCR